MVLRKQWTTTILVAAALFALSLVMPAFASTTDAAVKRKSADETVNNSTTLQNDDHLSFSIGANETWTFRLVLIGTTDNSYHSLAVTAPSGASCVYLVTSFASGASPVGCGSTVVSPIPSSPGDHFVIEVVGTVANGANSGTVQLQWAQDVADASDTTIKAGSFLNAFMTN